MRQEPIRVPATLRVLEGIEIELELDVYARKDEDGDVIVESVALHDSGQELEIPRDAMYELMDELKELF